VSKREVEDIEKIFSIMSAKVPELIKGIITSIFSEESTREMGKALGAFYKSLIESGIPEQSALKMTENLLSTFTLGEILRRVGIREEKELKKEEKREGQL